MQSLMIIFISSVMLRTISATEVSVKRTRFLHFACWFELPNKMVFYTNLCFKQWETAIWLQFNSHMTLATVCSWLRTTLWNKSHHEKPAKSACKCFTLKGTTPVVQYCSLSLQVVELACNQNLAWPRLLRNGSTWLQPWHSLKCKMLMER